jgi:hypothetical protein
MILPQDVPARNGEPGVPPRSSPASRAYSLGEYLDQEVLPRLKPEQLYEQYEHHWQKAGDRWRGCCPWHASESGTSFVVTLANMLWFCAGCNIGGGPLQYLHRLRGGNGLPRGEDFVNLVRELCVLADVSFPERHLTPEQQERHRRLETRRSILESVYALCRQGLLSEKDLPVQARAYLASRGFTDEHQESLELGLYPPIDLLRAALGQLGHTGYDVEHADVLFDKMVGYITFPWRDDRGRPLTLYGTWTERRPPEGVPKKMALPNPGTNGEKWLATKSSPYLLDRALGQGHRDLVLVEGVTDAALCQGRGDTRVISCVAGTVSREQVQTLCRRGIVSITIALDPDRAGENNTAGTIRALAEAGITPYVAPTLPDGLDPDDFVMAHGIEAWREHIQQRGHGYRYLSKKVIEHHWCECGQDGAGNDVWRDQLVARAVREAGCLPRNRPDELSRYFFGPVAVVVGADPGQLLARLERTPCSGGATPGGATPGGATPGGAPAAAGESYRPSWLKTADLLARDCCPSSLVRPVLVAGQPCIIGAPKKTMKTSLMVDLAVSLASGTDFLQHFEVDRSYRVVMLSGESGEFTLQETIKRVCPFRIVDPEEIDCLWGFSLPRLSRADDLAALQQALRETGREVLILDPLYLALLNGNGDLNAANLYQMGPLLLDVCRACLDVGCTPLLVHHATRQLKTGEVMQLEHLAFAGIAEFARQWLLLSRREAYLAGSGSHKLWLNYGGSAGQSGCVALDIEEGQLLDNFQGRRWDVAVQQAGKAIRAQRNAKQEAKEAKEAEQLEEDEAAILDALDRLDQEGKGVSKEEVREVANLGTRGCSRLDKAVKSLVEKELVEKLTVQVPTGRNGMGTRAAAGIRRCPSGVDGGEEETLSGEESLSAG